MDGSFVEGMSRRFDKKRDGRSGKNDAPPTRDYWYGNHGRRWAGRGRKDPYKSWKKTRKLHYRIVDGSSQPEQQSDG